MWICRGSLLPVLTFMSISGVNQASESVASFCSVPLIAAGLMRRKLLLHRFSAFYFVFLRLPASLFLPTRLIKLWNRSRSLSSSRRWMFVLLTFTQRLQVSTGDAKQMNIEAALCFWSLCSLCFLCLSRLLFCHVLHKESCPWSPECTA